MEGRWIFLCFLGVVAGQRVTLQSMGEVNSKILSVAGDTVEAFLGLPYAKPPVGELRFALPQPLNRTESTYNATFFRNVCPSPPNFASTSQVGEDCLYLNIYRPALASPNNKKAVMVYIPGYYDNTINLNPEPMVVHGDIILVTVNMRLGVLGFLSTDDENVPGNMGLWDVKAALEWLRTNIEAFGGSSNRITVFGQSIGGAYTSLLAMSPKCDTTLFQRIIPQSGSLLSFRLSYEQDTIEQARSLARKLNCTTDSTEDMITCLSLVDLLELQEASSSGFHWAPVQDDSFLPINLPEAYTQYSTYSANASTLFAQMKSYDMMTGFNSQEGLLGINILGAFNISEGITNEKAGEVLDSMMTTALPGLSNDFKAFLRELIIYRYIEMEPTISDTGTSLSDQQRLLRAFVAITGDMLISWPVIEMANLHSDGNDQTNTYTYLFDYKSSLDLSDPEWLYTNTAHGSEVDLIFGHPTVPGSSFSVTDSELSRTMMTYWTNFAKFGNPTQTPVSNRLLNSWPEYNLQTNYEYVHISTQSDAAETNPLSAVKPFWRSLNVAVGLEGDLIEESTTTQLQTTTTSPETTTTTMEATTATETTATETTTTTIAATTTRETTTSIPSTIKELTSTTQEQTTTTEAAPTTTTDSPTTTVATTDPQTTTTAATSSTPTTSVTASTAQAVTYSPSTTLPTAETIYFLSNMYLLSTREAQTVITALFIVSVVLLILFITMTCCCCYAHHKMRKFKSYMVKKP